MVTGMTPLFLTGLLRYGGYLLAALLLPAMALRHRRVRRQVESGAVELTQLRDELRRATAAAERNREQLAATLGAIPDLLFELDLDGRYIEVHATRVEQLAAPPEALLGRRVSEVLSPDAASVCMAALQEANSTGWSTGRQIKLQLSHGAMWFELSVAKKPSEPDGSPRFVVLSHDITYRKSAEADVRRLSKLYAALSHCNQLIVRCKNETELLPQICRGAVTFGGMKMAWIGLLDEHDRLVKPAACFGDGTAYLSGIRISMERDDQHGRGPTGTAMRENRPVWCQDFVNEPSTTPWHERGRRFGWAASAALPLHRAGRVIGAMTLYADEVNGFDAAAQELLMEMARDIDFAFDRFLEDAERARMAEVIVESEEKYRAITESITDVIWTLDPVTGRFLYVSPSVFRLCGYTAEEFMAGPNDSGVAQEGRALSRELLTARMADFLAERRSSGDFAIEEVEQHCKDGATVWTEVVTNLALNQRSGQVELHGVIRDISERKNAEARIQHLAYFDQLTGLPNRVMLNDHCAYALTLAHRSGQPLAVLFFDLDHFKTINDTLGHDVGDQLLIEVGRRLVAQLRAGDTVARLGGDEFVLILADTNAAGAMHVALKLLQVISQPYLIGFHELRTTLSIGIAMYPEDGADMDLLFRNADAAMYQVKRDSRNDYRFFTEEMQARSLRTLSLANALHHALERGQLSLQYQPQVSLRDGGVIGAEALLRWTHPEFGAISPAEFIPIAENNGLIMEIGDWVLQRAVEQACCWREEGLPPLVVAVNLSAAQFRRPNLPELVIRIIEKAGLPAGELELELTEAVAMDDPQRAIKIMAELFQRGIRIAIDDFGTGYSSLSTLKQFKVNKLKIDRSFVDDIVCDADDRAIVRAIIQLARSLNLKTIAEGVERNDVLELLRDLGCDEVQGYLYSPPLAAEQFSAWVRNRSPLLPDPGS